MCSGEANDFQVANENSSVEITTASTDDTDVIVDLWVDLSGGQQEYGSHLLADDNRMAIREAIVQRIVTDDVLVARVDDRVVGFVMMTLEHGRYKSDTDQGVIENIYVRDGFRGDGIGTALLTAAEDALTETGVETISLEVMAENDGARRFYQSNGYFPHRIELEKSTENDTL